MGEFLSPLQYRKELRERNSTIFMQDTGHILFDAHGCGTKRREILDEQIKTGERSFKEVSEEMWGSLKVPFDDGFEVMEKTLEIDPDFQEFHKFCIVSISLEILIKEKEGIVLMIELIEPRNSIQRHICGFEAYLEESAGYVFGRGGECSY